MAITQSMMMKFLKPALLFVPIGEKKLVLSKKIKIKKLTGPRSPGPGQGLALLAFGEHLIKLWPFEMVQSQWKPAVSSSCVAYI